MKKTYKIHLYIQAQLYCMQGRIYVGLLKKTIVK